MIVFVNYIFTAKYGYNSSVMEVQIYVAVLYFPSKLLEMSSRLHVTLLVFLRLLAIKFPLTFQDMHIKMSRICITIIWMISFIFSLIITLIGVFGKKEKYFVSKLAFLHISGTLPVIVIVIMNLFLLRTLRRRNHTVNSPSQKQISTLNRMDSSRTEALNKKMTGVVLKVVGFLLVCYIPLLAWRHHYYAVVVYRENSEFTDTEVSFQYV